MAGRVLRASRRARTRDREAARDRVAAGRRRPRGAPDPERRVRSRRCRPQPAPVDRLSRGARLPRDAHRARRTTICTDLAGRAARRRVRPGPRRGGVPRRATGRIRGSLGIHTARPRVLVEDPPAERAVRPRPVVPRQSRGRCRRRDDLHRRHLRRRLRPDPLHAVVPGASKASAERSSRTRSDGSGSVASAASGLASTPRARQARFDSTSVPA